ncbi:TIGR00730 family Rossman fold protein [Asticcacaulis sp. BYS171W]|uniref:Cytokinin riboside 5'-monophosphate phosphoribohydrolase n=1 Tax=Asticcacaulis aquaticus TaxID=2984212 RepID=A0ABT5HWK3_9CAUL|nr:TIGR00730 family Rossman fold protein [Asticcacaulis aquaticus]MDC7684307.1 TIGR00730 family Rossman fold protein [Asticcacaulis aquaticus]
MPDASPAPRRPVLSVCIYCGSSDAVDQRYKDEAFALGKILGSNGLRLVYGGGGVGLMGESARGAHEAGGKVLGIMPQFLMSRERLYDDVETIVVQSMHERKMMMFEESDAFVVLPGGVGTLEEVIELLSWRRLDLHKKPIIFLNSGGFWEPFFKLVEATIATNFTPESFLRTYKSVDTVEEILGAINELSSHDEDIDTRKVL